MVTSVRLAPPLPLIFLLMIHGVSSVDWGVIYSPTHICAVNNSTVIMRCTYKYPTGYKIKKVFWTKTLVRDNVEPPDLSNDTEYSQRLQYLGDEQQDCTVRLSHVTLKDSRMYYFRFITDKEKWIGAPGVSLTVTDLQVESPERVTEGDSVSLTCKSSCALTDRATFIWYRNSLKILTESKFRNTLILNPVRREDSGRYSCAVDGHTHVSPDVHLNVMYPPRSVSVSIIQSGQIWAGDSVTLKCISDSNPPAVNFSWFKENESSAVGSGQSFSALQSGRFYCQAHNQHGSQRSDAVTVTVKYWRIYHIAIVASVCGVVATGIIVLLTCWKKLHSKSTTNNSDGISMKSENKQISYVYENVGAVHPRTNAPKMTFPLYENVTIYENCTANRKMP
ncbi:B-cell receptor CD22-like isoform X2 [Pimephales promelas]|uniref:B-cell receptor CD22-like isoform X2 n=1 Tax=Pimephales promelas TaxID=90988 RepID=UPI0019559B2B|nr:B-cell receptor CD22-like isoform X2 [Pimephales promelas]